MSGAMWLAHSLFFCITVFARAAAGDGADFAPLLRSEVSQSGQMSDHGRASASLQGVQLHTHGIMRSPTASSAVERSDLSKSEYENMELDANALALDSRAQVPVEGHVGHELLEAEPNKTELINEVLTEHYELRAAHAELKTQFGYEQKASVNMATCASLMLLGTVTFVMALFYFVQWKDDDIRNITWTILASTISIFCTILLFMASKTASNYVFGKKKYVDAGYLAFSFFRFIILFKLVPIGLLRFMDRPVALLGWGTIGAHFIGFAGMDAFGSLLLVAPFSDSKGMCFLGVLLGGFILAVFCNLAAKARHWWCERDGTVTKYEEQWNHQCEHTENEFVGFIMGLCISMFCRFCITNTVPAVHGSPHHKSDAQVWALAGIAVFLIIVLVVMNSCMKSYEESANHNTRRAVAITKEIVSMTTGWVLLFLGYWTFWRWSDDTGFGSEAGKLVAAMTLAFLYSFLVFFVLFTINFVCKKQGATTEHAEALNGALILLIGFSWETAFYVAIKGASGEWQDQKQKTIVDVTLMLGMCAIALPAWILYIVPMVMKSHAHDAHGEHGHATAHAESHDDANKSLKENAHSPAGAAARDDPVAPAK